MASVKNLKSQGKAWPDGLWSTDLYPYRKQQFADTPPAKILKPVRVLKQAAQAALNTWDRRVVAGGDAGFPHQELYRYDKARAGKAPSTTIQRWAVAA